jgi:hypothetical protein
MPARPKTPIAEELSADDWKKQVEQLLRSVRADSLTPEQVMAKLRELAPGATVSADSPTVVVSERTTRGYKVRRSLALLTEEQRKARQAITLEAMAQALKEVRR